MVLWLRFNLAEATSAGLLQGEGQAQQKPNSAKALVVEAERKGSPGQGKWQEAQHTRNWDSEKQTRQKAHVAQSRIAEDPRLR